MVVCQEEYKGNMNEKGDKHLSFSVLDVICTHDGKCVIVATGMCVRERRMCVCVCVCVCVYERTAEYNVCDIHTGANHVMTE